MDEVALIREKIDLVPFISEYVPLKKTGRNFSANCPFHTEKTPSFMVSPERQRWHCFGCGKGGDIYTFLIEYERLEFPEALRLLAKRAGITLSSRPVDTGIASKKEKLYEINSLSREFYHFILTKHHAGRSAREYLQRRGVTAKIIETFQLGFAPGIGSALLKYLINKKLYEREDVLSAGLIANRGGRLMDFFHGRLMFPLIDHRDNVVGFSGRLLDPEATTFKYINTPDTLIYHKSDHIYGLSISKEAIRKANQVIIVEGEFDVISCFANGISNVVGVKGTALTENQVNLLSRFAAKITFCFDGDKAGQAAIIRSLLVVEKKDLTPTVIEIPIGKDPDEALRSEPALFKKAVKEDTNVYDYLLNKLSASVDMQTAQGKKQVADTLLPLFANIKNEIIKEHYLRKISSTLATSYESIAKEMQRLAVKETVKVPRVLDKTKRAKDEVMEEYLLSLIVQSDAPKTIVEKVASILSGALSKERAYQKIMYLLIDHFQNTDKFDSRQFADGLPQELVENYDTCLLFPLPPFTDAQKLQLEVEKIAANLRLLYIRQKMKKLADEIKQKELVGLEQEAAELKKSYSLLASNLESA